LPSARLKRLIQSGWENFGPKQSNRVVIATIEGITYELALEELIDKSIYYSGCFESTTTDAIRRLCKPGMVILDVGANVGCHALRMAQLVGRTGRVIAFEPMPWANGKIRKNLSLNHLGNVTVENFGLSDEACTARVHFRSSWKTIGEKRGGEAVESTRTCSVDFVRVDDYLVRHAIGRVDLVKLDVDGYEFKVLRGAANLLTAHKPVIVIELGAYSLRAVGDRIEDMVAFLAERGYRFYRETDLSPYSSFEEMLKSIPADGTINAVASTRPCIETQHPAQRESNLPP
jgi:FkbM family methyltransferase